MLLGSSRTWSAVACIARLQNSIWLKIEGSSGMVVISLVKIGSYSGCLGTHLGILLGPVLFCLTEIEIEIGVWSE